MNKLFTIFVNRFGWFGFLRLLFYPVTVLVTTPIRLVQTLWNCRILANGQWKNYSHFTPFSGMNHLFYWTTALNLYDFGCTGHSPYIGLGNHSLSRFFHYSLISLCSYWKASTVTLLFGMFGWALTHLVWVSHLNASWVLLIILLAIISTTFYANLFALQNYSVLGWLLFPLGLYGIFTNNWILAATAWFLASFGSFTVVFLAGIISIVSAVMNLSLAPVFAFIPAALKLLVQVYPLLIHKNIKSSVLNIMKFIGMFRVGVKYKRIYSVKTMITTVYFLFLYGQFAIISYLISGQFSVLFLTGLAIFIANSTYIRFADIQSMQMLMFSLATAEVLQTPDLWFLLSYWILIAPLALLAPFPFMKKVLDVVPVLAPFSIEKLREDMKGFLAQVKPEERVLMAFDNPKGVYRKIFDGYRALLELPLYVSSKKKVHFMPDNWAVLESNYEGAPDFWGRDVDSVLRNIKFWKADFVVIYQNAGTKLDREWEAAGFSILSKFSWTDYEKELRSIKPYCSETPDWWLLKVPRGLRN